MPLKSQRRLHLRARKTTATTMSGSTVSNKSSSLSSTPSFPTFSTTPCIASPNPSTVFGFSPISSSSTTPSLSGGATAVSASSLGLQSSNSSADASFSAPVFGSSPLIGGSGSPFAASTLFGSTTGTVTPLPFSASSVSDSSSLFKSAVSASSPKKLSPGSETPVHEKSVIQEEEEGSGVQVTASSKSETEEFDGISMAADKTAILLRIQRMHPLCLPSLRLRAKAHRRTAYDHLVQVILDLKAIGGNGDPNSYTELIPSLDDLEFYGFQVTWLRELVLQLQKNAERRQEKEAKRKAREELLKQLEAIDAELATIEDASAGSMESLSALFETP